MESGNVTGTKDKNYNIIWFTEQSLSNALRLEEYVQNAERDGDNELADFFRRAQEAVARVASRASSSCSSASATTEPGPIGCPLARA